MRHTLTIGLTDHSHYNHISYTASITARCSKVNYCVTNLTTMCYIQVLDKDDRFIIEMEGERYNVYFYPYSKIEVESFVFMIEKQMLEAKLPVKVKLADTHLLSFEYSKPFKIIDMIYNLQLLYGAYNCTFPMEAEEVGKNKYVLSFASVGYMLSTPILYLLSNNGRMNFSNKGSSGIVMRINNSFSSGFPIVANNG
ncbi:hypothetical protein TRFO_39821 [Tritrichomonas foetus]|uniref:Uncharacterized protein n=1 Tax=Tritrichomonas foetus TaxID=1144522 RepID=A0A1J4J763_9EUKA|nr:hypothetical protein TRFO_39821 [Tritrichomonas foetus]|eukprot:OHS94023.1 hypothetical protein TRFO_39821 [Tritrichomonas foetus]